MATRSNYEQFESEEEEEEEADVETAYRPPVAKRPHYPPQLFPETEMAVLTPPILLPTEEDLSPPQLIAPSIAPPRLTPIPRVHCEGTPPPPPPSPHADEEVGNELFCCINHCPFVLAKVTHQSYWWEFLCVYMCGNGEVMLLVWILVAEHLG